MGGHGAGLQEPTHVRPGVQTGGGPRRGEEGALGAGFRVHTVTQSDGPGLPWSSWTRACGGGGLQ